MVIQGIQTTNNLFLESIARGTPPDAPQFTPRTGNFFQRIAHAHWETGYTGVLAGRHRHGSKSATLQIVELDEQGDTAIEVGAYTPDIQPEGADPIKDSGKYVVIWKRQTDGSGKWAVDIFNTDLPA